MEKIDTPIVGTTTRGMAVVTDFRTILYLLVSIAVLFIAIIPAKFVSSMFSEDKTARCCRCSVSVSSKYKYTTSFSSPQCFLEKSSDGQFVSPSSPRGDGKHQGSGVSHTGTTGVTHTYVTGVTHTASEVVEEGDRRWWGRRGG